MPARHSMSKSLLSRLAASPSMIWADTAVATNGIPAANKLLLHTCPICPGRMHPNSRMPRQMMAISFLNVLPFFSIKYMSIPFTYFFL